jgi:hypothetical protein
MHLQSFFPFLLPLLDVEDAQEDLPPPRPTMGEAVLKEKFESKPETLLRIFACDCFQPLKDRREAQLSVIRGGSGEAWVNPYSCVCRKGAEE